MKRFLLASVMSFFCLQTSGAVGHVEDPFEHLSYSHEATPADLSQLLEKVHQWQLAGFVTPADFKRAETAFQKAMERKTKSRFEFPLSSTRSPEQYFDRFAYLANSPESSLTDLRKLEAEFTSLWTVGYVSDSAYRIGLTFSAKAATRFHCQSQLIQAGQRH